MDKNKKTYWVEQRHIEKAGKYEYWESPAVNPISFAIKERLHRPVYITDMYDAQGEIIDCYYDTSSGNTRSFTLCKKGKTLFRNWANGKKVRPTEITITLID